jgi:hypothetical protein
MTIKSKIFPLIFFIFIAIFLQNAHSKKLYPELNVTNRVSYHNQLFINDLANGSESDCLQHKTGFETALRYSRPVDRLHVYCKGNRHVAQFIKCFVINNKFRYNAYHTFFHLQFISSVVLLI